TARGILASKELARWSTCFAKREVGYDPIFVHLRMCEEQKAPLGWVMAKQTRDAIDRLLEADSCNAAELHKLERALLGDELIAGDHLSGKIQNQLSVGSSQ